MCDQRPDADDLPHTEWKCESCGAFNSMWDPECQFCEDPCNCDDGGSAGCPVHDNAVKSSLFEQRWRDKCDEPCPTEDYCGCRAWAAERENKV